MTSRRAVPRALVQPGWRSRHSPRDHGRPARGRLHARHQVRQRSPSRAPRRPATSSFWHFFTDREAKAIDAVVKDFEAGPPEDQGDGQVRPGRLQGDPGHLRRQGSRRRAVLLHRHRRQVLLAPARGATSTPYIERDKVDLTKLTATDQAVHRVRRQAVRDAVPRRRVRHLLQQEDARRGRASPARRRRSTSSSDDAKKLTKKQRRRHHRGRRLPAAVRLLRELAGAPGPGGRRQVARPPTASPRSAATRAGRSC